MAAQGKTVLVLGGGVGGLITANELRRRLGDRHRIVLVDRKAEHIAYSSLLWMIIGAREPGDIRKDISRLLSDNVEFVNETIEQIDPANRSVRTGSGEITGDYLVISLGAALAPETIPGLTDAFQSNAFNLYDFQEAIKIRDALRDFSRGDLVVMVSSVPYKCPVAPNEGSLLLNYYFTKRGVRKDVRITVCTPEVLPLGGNGPKTGTIVKGLMEDAGVEYRSQHKVTSVNPANHEIIFDKGTLHYDLLLAIPPHRAPAVVKESGLSEPEWVPVEKGTMQTKFDHVYALGDVNTIKLPGEWKQGVPLILSKGGVFAHYEAKVVAQNIANEIQGKSERVQYTGRAACFVETGFCKAALAQGTFFTADHPSTTFLKPSRLLHVAKVLFEKYWLSESIFRRLVDLFLEKTVYGKYKIYK